MRLWIMGLVLLFVVLVGCGEQKRVAVFPAPTPEDLSRGAVLYQTHCAPCHGQPAVGDLPIFKPLATSPIVAGDPGGLVANVFRHPDHVDKRNGYGLFNDLNDADFARLMNYLRTTTGESLAPVRTRTVEQLRKADRKRRRAQ